MLFEDLAVGDKVLYPTWDKPYTITEIDELNIAYTDRKYINSEGNEEFDCFIMKFNDGTYNKLVEKVEL